MTMRRIMGLLIGVIVLAACGETTTVQPVATEPAATTAAAATPEAAATTQPTTQAPEATSAAATTERVVVHAMGETTLPATIERVVVLDNGALDNLLAMGLTPIGAATVLDDGAFPPYLEGQTSGIQSVGLIDQPNLETITALKPELILGTKAIHEEVYAQLSQIAPTVLVPELGGTWKENLRIQADAIGKPEAGQKLMSDYEQRIATFQEQMGDKLTTTEVSVVRSTPDHLRIYMNSSFIGTILKDTGIGRPAGHDQDKVMEKISTEQLPSVDGSVIFFAHRNPAESQIVTLMKEPLWQTLKAAQAGKVYEVSHDVWISGLGIQSVNIVLDDLTRLLIEPQS